MKICIYTEQDVTGKKAIPIREDRIIGTIRFFKKIFGVAQNNELFVSEDHIEEHRKRRKSFEQSMLFASVFAGIVILLVLFSLVFNQNYDLWAFISAFVIGGFVLALPLFKYSPALQGNELIIINGEQNNKEIEKTVENKGEKNGRRSTKKGRKSSSTS